MWKIFLLVVVKLEGLKALFLQKDTAFCPALPRSTRPGEVLGRLAQNGLRSVTLDEFLK